MHSLRILLGIFIDFDHSGPILGLLLTKSGIHADLDKLIGPVDHLKWDMSRYDYFDHKVKVYAVNLDKILFVMDFIKVMLNTLKEIFYFSFQAVIIHSCH